MGNLGNKEVMAINIQRLMDKNKIDRKDLAKAINTPYTTVCDWVNGKTYPRIDKIEMMANYFNVNKSDLVEDIEEKQSYYLDPETAEMAQELFERPEMRVLFDASRKATKEDIEQVADILKKLSEK